MSALPVFGTRTAARFACTSSGNCCCGWQVPVDRVTYDRIGALLVEAEENPLELASISELAVPPNDREYARFRLVDGRCAFLDEDRLCHLHRRYGSASKPLACRSFPFTYVATPSGNYPNPSFACPGMLSALVETAGDLAVVRIASGEDPYIALPEHGLIFFDSGQTGGVTVRGFEALMRAFLVLLAEGAPSAEIRLLATRLWLEELANRKIRLSYVEVKRSLENANREDLTARARAIPANLSLLRTILAELLRRRREAGAGEADTPMRFAQVIARYLDADDAAEQRFLADIDATYRTQQGALAPILVTFLANRLFFNARHFQPGILAGFSSVIATLALVRLFAIADAWASGGFVTQEVLLRNLEYVEREFSHSFRVFDWGENVIEFESRRFASALLAL